MPDVRPRAFIDMEFEEAAQAYLKSLPPEHFMEADPQARQREISLASFALIHAVWPEFQYFNEMSVQYNHGRNRRIRQVVPDNMVVIHRTPIRATSSYNLPLQPCGPRLVLEYVSKGNKRKDYEDSFNNYEKELKVPYYMIFYPDNQELTLYQLGVRKYRAVKPNKKGRYPIPDLKMELELLDGWVRYWFRGRLLPLPGELQQELDKVRQIAEQERQRADQEAQARLALEQEVARLRAKLGLLPEAPG